MKVISVSKGMAQKDVNLRQIPKQFLVAPLNHCQMVIMRREDTRAKPR